MSALDPRQMTDTEKSAVIVASAVIICLALLLAAYVTSHSLPKQECRDAHGRAAFCKGGPL